MRPSRLLQPSSARTFESLYKRHLDDIYRYSLALLDRPADAEDATQATFLNAYRAIEKGERPRNSRRWLRAIALNVCREHWRRLSRRPDEVSLEEDPGELVEDEPTPAVSELMRAMSKLPFNQRAALVMREFEGRSLGEIARALGVTGASVESLLFRARRGLREQLDGSIRCHEAEALISRQLDGRITYTERGQLRAHLRECSECGQLARRLRAQRKAIRSLAVVPVPAGLALSGLPLAPAAKGGASAAAGSSAASGGPLLGAAGASVGVKTAGVALLAAATIAVGYAATAGHGSHASSLRKGARSPSARSHPDSAAGSALIAGGARKTTSPAGAGGRSAGAAPGRGRGNSGSLRLPANGGLGTHSQQSGSSLASASPATSSSGSVVAGGHPQGLARGQSNHGSSGGHPAPKRKAHPTHPANPNGHVPPGGTNGNHGHQTR